MPQLVGKCRADGKAQCFAGCMDGRRMHQKLLVSHQALTRQQDGFGHKGRVGFPIFHCGSDCGNHIGVAGRLFGCNAV